MSNEMLIIILGMGIVTYIPRMLPLVFINGKEIPTRHKSILQNVPYAALGALIFPGVLFIQEELSFGIIGGITAFIVAYFTNHLLIVVISSISVLILYSFLF